MKYWPSALDVLFSFFFYIVFQDVEAELKNLEIMKDDLENELNRVTSIRTYPDQFTEMVFVHHIRVHVFFEGQHLNNICPGSSSQCQRRKRAVW